MSKRRIGILTGGGDAPGLNAVIRAVVKSARQAGGYEVIGIRDGFDGLIKDDGVIELNRARVRGILPRGGTILGTANRGNPFARKIMRDGVETIEDVSDEVLARVSELDLESLIVVGGDGTLRISMELFEKGCPVIGVPKTIDNDVGGTEVTFGYDTAVNIAMEAIDRLHTTAESHHRVMVVELMGRDAGFIALRAGVAGGADVILIPEIPFSFTKVCDKIIERVSLGRHFSIVAVAEGAYPAGGEQVYRTEGDEIYTPRLGGIGLDVAAEVEKRCNIECRVIVLGHLQRGGTPTAFDRWLATRFGAAAFRLAAERKYGGMVALRCGKIEEMSLEEALRVNKRVDLEGDPIQTARGLNLCLGDN